MPLLFILLLVLCARSLTYATRRSTRADLLVQPGFLKDFGGRCTTALGLAFFKLSIGMGTMLTYGSYFRDDQNIPVTTHSSDAGRSYRFTVGWHCHLPGSIRFRFAPEAG